MGTPIFIEGWENGDIDKNWTAGSNIAIQSNGSSFPAFSGSYHGYTSSGYLRKTFGSTYNELNVSFKARPEGLNRGVFGFEDSGSTLTAYLNLNASGYLELKVGSSVVDTGTTLITVQTTYFFQIYYKPLNSGGQFTVYLNGVEELSYSGDTTDGLENIKSFTFGCSSPTGYLRFDDLVVDSSAMPGNCRVQAIVPTGAGNSTQWDPSTGNNWDCVDEIPYSDSDYVSTNTTNEIDTYQTGDLTGVISSVVAVQLEARLAYEGSPTPTHVQLGVRSGGTDYFDTDLSPALSFGDFIKMLATDPDTASAWLESGVNGMELGIKATA